MARRGSNFLDAAKQILEESGEPMRGEEIVRIGLERGLFTTRSPNEEAACRSLINTLNTYPKSNSGIEPPMQKVTTGS